MAYLRQGTKRRARLTWAEQQLAEIVRIVDPESDLSHDAAVYAIRNLVAANIEQYAELEQRMER